MLGENPAEISTLAPLSQIYCAQPRAHTCASLRTQEEVWQGSAWTTTKEDKVEDFFCGGPICGKETLGKMGKQARLPAVLVTECTPHKEPIIGLFLTSSMQEKRLFMANQGPQEATCMHNRNVWAQMLWYDQNCPSDQVTDNFYLFL